MMLIRIGALRHIIREAIGHESKTRIAQQVIDVAGHYVDSVVAGSPNKVTAEELRQQAEQLASYAKYLINKREPDSDSIGMIAKYALDLAELSTFWNRPAFLGKQEYAEKLQNVLRRMQKFQANLS